MTGQQLYFAGRISTRTLMSPELPALVRGQKYRNNPMHSSGMVDTTFPPIDLTRRANHWHDATLTQFARRIRHARVIVTTDALDWQRAIAGWRRRWTARSR